MLGRLPNRIWLLPFVVLLGASLTCEKGKDIDVTSKTLKDGANFEIPAVSHVAYPFSVTEDMVSVPGHEGDVQLFVNCRTTDGDTVTFLLLTEDNYYAWEQSLPYTAIAEDRDNCFSQWYYMRHLGDYCVAFSNPTNFATEMTENGNPNLMVALTWWVFK